MIEWLQKFVRWTSSLSVVEKASLSVAIAGVGSLLLALIWARPSLWRASRTVYLTYPLHHFEDCDPLIDAVKASINDMGFKTLLPPTRGTRSEDLQYRLESAAAVIALYIPVEGTVLHAEVAGSITKQARPSSWIDATVGAARVPNSRQIPVLAIQDKRIEVFGLPRAESFLCNIAFDPEDTESLKGIKSAIEAFLQSVPGTRPSNLQQ